MSDEEKEQKNFENEAKEADSPISTANTTNSISPSSTGRIFFQAIGEIFKSNAANPSLPINSSASKFGVEIDMEEFRKQLKIVNFLLDSEAPSCFQQEYLAINDFCDAMAVATKETEEKAKCDFIAAIDEQISKKLEDSTVEMKAEMSKLKKENKKMKEEMEMLKKMLNKSLEYTKTAFEMKAEFVGFRAEMKKELDIIRGMMRLN